jgi:hypothetical protein
VAVSATTGMPSMSRDEGRQEEGRSTDAAQNFSHKPVAPPRVKGESAEERKMRKDAVREDRVGPVTRIKSRELKA